MLGESPVGKANQEEMEGSIQRFSDLFSSEMNLLFKQTNFYCFLFFETSKPTAFKSCFKKALPFLKMNRPTELSYGEGVNFQVQE
jgi:heme oxygenase